MIEKLTQSRVNSFSIPDKRTDVRDELVTGLVLRLEVSGRKSWYVVYRHKGKQRWFFIGNAEFFTLAEARNEARAFLGLLARGEDPFAVDPDPEMTVKELIETHYKPWVTVHRKSGNSTIQSLYFYFSSFFDRSISSITVPELEQ